MLCPNCETDNRDSAKFCDQCGFPLSGAVAEVAHAAFSGALSADVEPYTSDVEETSDDEFIDETQPQDELYEADVQEISHESSFDESSQSLDEVQDLAADDASLETLGEDTQQTQLDSQDYPDEITPDITVSMGANLSGLGVAAEHYGEQLLDPNLTQPQAYYRDGQTMQMPSVEAEGEPQSKSYLASATKEQGSNPLSNRTKLLAIIGGIIALIALVVFCTYQMQLWGGKTIPDVKGMTEADARSVLEEVGFTVRSTQVKSDDTEGLVLLMDPTANSRAEEGSEVVIHIASARTIPEIVGKTEEEAKAALDEAGYVNVSYEPERSDNPEGTVLSITPEAGQRAKSTVAVVVKIAEAYMVPDIAGLDYNAAVAAIQDAGLGYDVAHINTQDYPDGSIMGTEPAAHTKVTSDTIVIIDIARARGAELISLTQNMLSPGSTVNIDGVSYEIEALNSVEYVGGDTVSFTFTGRPYTYILGQFVSLDSRQVSGQIEWTSENGVNAIY